MILVNIQKRKAWKLNGPKFSAKCCVTKHHLIEPLELFTFLTYTLHFNLDGEQTKPPLGTHCSYARVLASPFTIIEHITRLPQLHGWSMLMWWAIHVDYRQAQYNIKTRYSFINTCPVWLVHKGSNVLVTKPHFQLMGSISTQQSRIRQSPNKQTNALVWYVGSSITNSIKTIFDERT